MTEISEYKRLNKRVDKAQCDEELKALWRIAVQLYKKGVLDYNQYMKTLAHVDMMHDFLCD